MPTIAIDKIIVENRQREDLGDLSSMKESFQEVGLIHPVVIDDMNRLIAGERRLTSAKELEWPEIEYRRLGDLDERDRQKIELEENLHRKDLTPEEKLRALKLIHDLYTEDNPTNSRGPAMPGQARHTIEDTAEIVGKSKSSVAMELQVANTMAILPEKLQKEIYAEAGEGGIAAVKRALDKRVAIAAKSIDIKERAAEFEASDDYKADNAWADIRHTDAFEENGFASLENNSVDLIVTDPPYGVLEESVFDKLHGDSATTQRRFEDDGKSTMELLERAIPEMYRVLAPDSHMYLFCSFVPKDFNLTTNYPHFVSIANMCERAGFNVRPAPLIWSKSNIQGVAGAGQQWPFSYETILFARKGSRPIGLMPTGDVISRQPINGHNKRHKTQKPIKLLDFLMTYSSSPKGLFLDPFAGSASSLVSAKWRMMRVIGFEKDQQTATEARQWLIELGSLPFNEALALLKDSDGRL